MIWVVGMDVSGQKDTRNKDKKKENNAIGRQWEPFPQFPKT